MEKGELEVIVAAILATGITASGQQPASEEYSVKYFAKVLERLRTQKILADAAPPASPVG